MTEKNNENNDVNYKYYKHQIVGIFQQVLSILHVTQLNLSTAGCL